MTFQGVPGNTNACGESSDFVLLWRIDLGGNMQRIFICLSLFLYSLTRWLTWIYFFIFFRNWPFTKLRPLVTGYLLL